MIVYAGVDDFAQVLQETIDQEVTACFGWGVEWSNWL
jgi:hypothetical protein